jgi:CRP-like cAMP-binding protein
MPLLDTLDREERLRFAVFAAEHSFHAADCVFRQGDPGDALFIILKGCVKIRVDTDTGEEKTLNTLADGDIFGEMAIYTGDPRCANAYCIEDCRLLAIRKTDFDWLLSKNPTLSLKIVRLLSRKLANETKMFGRYESNG